MQLLWNGDKADIFYPSRGVRQGDPLSPYMFVICMEKLAHLIQSEIEYRHWRPICLTKNGPPISHLFFADDIILFGEASVHQANVIHKCLEMFCTSSGLKVNSTKTRIFFSNNVNHNRSSEISSLLGFTQSADLGKYLGVKLHHNRVTKDTFGDVIDRVKSRLSHWKVNCLSAAGRTTLISSVTNAIPGYVMQTSLLPTHTCDMLDKYNRNFLWGSSDEHRKVSLVAWDEVCKSKKRGGLGIRHAIQQNQAYLMKIGWNLVNRRNDFWVKVVRDKYKCGFDLLPKIDANRHGSNLWLGIKKVWGKVYSGLESVEGGRTRWRWNKNGSFSVKSAYESLQHEEMIVDPLWEKIWKIKVPERCRMFLWTVAHKRLLTNASRRKRGLSNDDACPVCNSNSEDLIHVLRDCEHTLNLWHELVNPEVWSRFTSLEFSEWFRWNLIMNKGKDSEEWRAIFASTCWWIWRRRNLYIFERKKLSNFMIISSVRSLLSSMQDAHRKFHKGHGVSLQNVGTEARWRPPEQGCIKINVDGAFSNLNHNVACGGILRDDDGRFLKGFMFKTYGGDNLTAELWGCLHGLKLAWDMGFRRATLESDSSDAIRLLMEEPNDLHADWGIIAQVKNLIKREWNVNVNQVCRWANTAADWLAKKGLLAVPGFHIVDQLHPELERIIVMERG